MTQSMCAVFNGQFYYGFFNVGAANIGQDPNGIVNYSNENDLDGYVVEVLQKQESHYSFKNVKDGGYHQILLTFSP